MMTVTWATPASGTTSTCCTVASLCSQLGKQVTTLFVGRLTPGVQP